MTRLMGLVLLALAGATNFGGGQDGSPIVGTDGVSGGLHVLRVDKPTAAGVAARLGERTGSRAVESPNHVRVMVFGLAADGIATPEPVASATAVPEPHGWRYPAVVKVIMTLSQIDE